MNKLIFFVLIVIFGGFIVGSCSRKVTPAEVNAPKDDSYDKAKFNYVYVEAIKQKLMGNSGDALKYFEDALQIKPSCDAAYYQMAQIVSGNGDLTNAKKFLKKALSIDDENIWYLMMMGGIYFQEEKLDSAIYYYKIAVKYFPQEENLQLTLGSLYSENKEYNKALAIFDTLDTKYGVNDNSTVSAVKVLIEEKNFDVAEEKTLQLLAIDPDEVIYNGLLAEIYVGKGEREKAGDVYEKLLERNPDDPKIQLAVCDFLINEKNYSELFLLLNNVILNSNVKRQDKISLFAKLIDLPDLVNKNSDELFIALMVFEANYKNDDIVPLLRPELLVKINRLDEAAELLENIIKQNPDNYYAWEKLLLLYNQKKDYKNLLIKGEECASRFNRSFLAKVLYANGALENKEYDIALEELKKAEILAGDNKEYITQVLTMRADVYYRMKDYLKAFETFEDAIRNDGEDLTVINNYAYYLAEQNKNLKEAEEMAKKVIDKEKNNNTYLDTYAWVLYKRGKLREAARVMEEILNSGAAPDAEYYEHYGFILSKEKNCQKAIVNWNYAIKLDSTKTYLKEEINKCGK